MREPGVIIGILLVIVIPIYTCTRIGLPEDHVDTSSCFDRACISESDWSEIGQKWLNFKDTVKVLDDTDEREIRKAIWQTFNNGRLWKGNAIEKDLRDIRNSRNILDKRTEEMRELPLKDTSTRYDHQAIIAMEGDTTVQKAAYFLYNKHPSVSTLYEYNTETDTLRVVAGDERILGSRSRVQIVGHGLEMFGKMRISGKTPNQLSEIVRKLTIKQSELGRVSLVGCNVGRDGQSEFLNDGFTEQFLKALSTHDVFPIQTTVSSRNGIVSVSSSGRKETGEITSEGIQWFSKDPLSKTIMTLGEFDEIIRTELPLTERIATYNQDASGALVRITDIDQSKSLQDNIKPIYIEKTDQSSGNIEVMKKISAGDLGEYLNTVTRSNFLAELDFVRQNIIERKINTETIKTEIEKTITSGNIPKTQLIIEQLRKVQIFQPNGKLLSHSEFKGNVFLQDHVNNKKVSDVFTFSIQLNEGGSIRIDLASAKENIKPFLLDSGVAPTWKYVARLTDAFRRVINVENVRTIQNRADLIYEINLLGTFGADYRSGRLSRYYRLGDVLYRMDPSNFYITWEGMVVSDSAVITKHFSDKTVREDQVPNKKSWLWLDRYGGYDFPRDSNFESYPDMLNKIQNQYIDNAINKQVDFWAKQGYSVHELRRQTTFNDEGVWFTLVDRGWSEQYYIKYDPGKVLGLMNDFINGQHSQIQKNMVHVLEGSMVLAIGLSESVRNSRSFPITEMYTDFNGKNSISLARLIETHPMTRGKSWGLVRDTGLYVVEYGHRWRQGKIVLPRELNIARTFLLSQKGHDDNSKYRFLTESEYHGIERQMLPGDLAKITGSIQTVDIRNTLADFRPQLTDTSTRTKPLGEIESPKVNDLEVYSDIVQGKSLPIRASASLVNDYIYITNKLNTAIAQKSLITGRDYEVVESTIEVENNNIKFTVRDKSNRHIEEEINLELDEDSLTSNKIKEEAITKLQDVQSTKSVPSKALTAVNEFLGVYGIVMGFRGAVQDFEDGHIFEGVVNVAQSVYGIYGMSQTAQRAVQKISSSIFSKGLENLETGLTEATTEMTTALTEGTTAAEETFTVAGEAAEDIPVLGTLFGVYNTIQDIRRGTAIGYVDAALDAAITISALFGPEALVVTVALTIVRLTIDDFYYTISNDLKNLPADATSLQKIGAVFKGIGDGIVKVFNHYVSDFFLFGLFGAIDTSNKIRKQYHKDRVFLHKLSDDRNYFNFEKEEGSSEKLVNFASGEESWNGGNIVFNLYENNVARFRMQIVDDEGKEKHLDRYMTLKEGTNDIVLGIGESHAISFKTEKAKVLFLFTVYSKRIISKVRGERETLHGTYYGNSKANKFFAIQKLPEGANLDYSLADYFYEIYGEDGDDLFYLGPQKSVVNGGNGRDTYIIPYFGGTTEINNYAEDLLEDVLFMQVDFEQINVDRNGNDLSLKHGYKHDVIVKSWFSGHRMGHLTFKANNGVIFNVTIGVHGQASSVPLAIILSGEKEGHHIDVSKGVWKTVILITGSDGPDFIKANDNKNLLDGGKGSNTIEGGAGSDVYLISSVDTSETSDWNEINNFDPKMTVDKVIFDISFYDIVPKPVAQDFQLYTNAKNGPKVLLKNWFLSEHFRHMMFATSDDVIFKLADDVNDPVLLHPIILDASNEKSEMTLDAGKPEFVNVSTIIGSDFDDNIMGNNGNNYIQGGQGSDKVCGGEGRDVYVIRKEDVGDLINNFAEDKKGDLILADFNYNDISVSLRIHDVEVRVSRKRLFTITDWLKGDNWRHVIVRTIDGISFEFGKDERVGIKKIPIEIDKSKTTTRQEIRANKSPMRSVEYIIGSNETDLLLGNNRSNRIDPGFGGAYMMALEGHDQYVIMDHYKGSNIVNNFAWDNLTDVVKLPAYFNDITTNVNGTDVIVSSSTYPSATVCLEKYTSDQYQRHLVVNTVKDGVIFTLPMSRKFEPVPISIDRSNQAHNLIVDLNIYYLWRDVVTVVGTNRHNNVIRGNIQNNTITGGKLSDTLEGGEGNDVIRGNEGDDFIDGGEGDDTLVGGAGEDWIDGGMGNDVIYPGPGGDNVKGGPGFDVILVFGDANNATGAFIDLLNGHGFGGDAEGDIYISVEGIIGGFYGDILVGDHNDNYLDGKEGNDILFPLDGNDILVGGDGKDMYEIGEIGGQKVIRNIAEDGIIDYVNLKFYETDLVYLEKRSDDLILHVGVIMDNLFCPKSDAGPYRIDQWYKGVKYQHITIQLAGENVVLNDFRTGSLKVHHESPDTESRRRKCDEILHTMFDYVDNSDTETTTENKEHGDNSDTETTTENKEHGDNRETETTTEITPHDDYSDTYEMIDNSYYYNYVWN